MPRHRTPFLGRTRQLPCLARFKKRPVYLVRASSPLDVDLLLEVEIDGVVGEQSLAGGVRARQRDLGVDVQHGLFTAGGPDVGCRDGRVVDEVVLCVWTVPCRARGCLFARE